MDAVQWRREQDPATPLYGRQKGPGAIQYAVVLLGQLAMTTLRPREGCAGSMQWR